MEQAGIVALSCVHIDSTSDFTPVKQIELKFILEATQIWSGFEYERKSKGDAVFYDIFNFPAFVAH